MNLSEELAEAEARVAALKSQVAGATCAEAGHIWKQIGGKNAGCCGDCCCSVPVHECERCGDCDYGDNDEADETIKACQEEERARADEEWFFDMDGKP